MKTVLAVVAQAQAIFRQKLEFIEIEKGLSLEQYVRYLSMQYHLTRNVQKHFFAIAGHSSLAAKPRLREFLIAFGLEEEPHYRLALKDLEHLEQELLPMPLDVKLWWSYFNSTIDSQPFVRLGATCILENLGSGGSDIVKRLLHNSPFITERTSRFIQVHLHEELPHGDQVVEALQKAELDSEILKELEKGAETGAILYLRMLDWVLGTDSLSNAISQPRNHLHEHEKSLLG
jgi:hypothetical protein